VDEKDTPSKKPQSSLQKKENRPEEPTTESDDLFDELVDQVMKNKGLTRERAEYWLSLV